MSNKHHRQLQKAQRRQLRRVVAAVQQSSAPSPLKARARSESPALPVDSIARLEKFDPHARFRNALREVAGEKNEWAGIPMPLDGEQLVVESRNPYAKGLEAIGAVTEPPDSAGGRKLRNRWYSIARRADIVLYDDDSGKVNWGWLPAFHSLEFQLRTLGCSDAWGIEQESRAIAMFAGMVSHRQFKLYMLTGTFLEKSERSGVTYMFRRLRPTVAIVPDKGGGTRILACLCMHPIAYYHGSWAGAMCPTDDVVAHLSLMRGDEAMFWKRCTQHPAWRPEAGL